MHIQIARGQASSTIPPTAVQDSAAGLWQDIVGAYERALDAGAAYKTDTNTELYRDPQHGVEFVLRVAAALRDKPKPPKDRHAPLCALFRALFTPVHYHTCAAWPYAPYASRLLHQMSAYIQEGPMLARMELQGKQAIAEMRATKAASLSMSLLCLQQPK